MKPWPNYGADEIEAVQHVLASGRVNYWNGEEGREFEREFAAFHDMPYAVAVSNGSVALELAIRALGIGEGDDVIVTPRTFLASASSIVLCGARPIFADVDPISQNITPETARDVLTDSTRAIMTVHLAGWPCDMPGFLDLARERGLNLIEDCAQAHGAKLDGQLVGSFGDAAAFSFCTDKIMTTGGEGGMVLFREEAAWSRGWSYKDHGKDWNAVYNREHPRGFRWLHESFGTNWRLTEMQAAIGRIQLQWLPEWSDQRRRNARLLQDCFRVLPALRVPEVPDNITHAYYKYFAFVRPERLATGWDRDRIMQAVQDEGFVCLAGGCPEVYREKAFVDAGMSPKRRLPVARTLGETSLMFLVHPTLSDKDMNNVADAVTKIMQQATAMK